jgi:hypothetical protein
MKSPSITSLRSLTLVGTVLASGGTVPGAPLGLPLPDTEQLESGFRTCVGLYEQPLAGALMRTIFDKAERETFATVHSGAVRSFSIEHEHAYSTATAQLNDGVTVAGVPVRAIYASTCELECPLAVFGLEFGPLKADQQQALQTWVVSAPSTHTPTHGDIKVQLNTTTDGQTLLICDVSG